MNTGIAHVSLFCKHCGEPIYLPTGRWLAPSHWQHKGKGKGVQCEGRDTYASPVPAGVFSPRRERKK